MNQTEILENLAVYTKCINFAAIKHKDQRRCDANKTPYINHPIGVAFILTAEGNITDPIVLQAALLHDTVEDTDTTFDEIEREFGPEVAAIVKEVTDDKALPKWERKQLQIERARGSSPKAKLVKLADKLYNLRDLDTNPPPSWDANRRLEYFKWAKQVVDNLRGTNIQIENSLDILFAKFIQE